MTKIKNKNKLLFHYMGTVQRVVDGDTIDVVFDLGFSVYKKERIRVARIDTPEITGRKAKEPVEKKSGLEAKDFVIQLCKEKGNKVFIHTTKLKKGRYNRIIGDLVFDDGSNLSDLIVEAGHAVYVKY